MAGSGIRVVQRGRGHARDERGSVLIITAAGLAALLGAVSLSVDIGNLSYTKRTLQTIADAAAQDARFGLDQGSSSCADAVKYAEQSATNNNFNYSASGNSLTVTLGNTSVVNNKETFDPDPASCTVPGADTDQAAATAVRVIAGGVVSYILGVGPDNPSAAAVWSGTSGMPETGVSIGTDLAAINTNDSTVLDPLLNDLLGTGSAVNLGVVGYQGLAGGSVTLGQLETAFGVGTVQALLNDQVTYKQLLSFTLSALQNNPSDPNATASISALNDLINETQNLTLLPKMVTLGSILDITNPGSLSAATVQANVLNLILASAEASNGKHTIQLDNLGVGVPGLLSTKGSSAYLISPPVSAYGPVGTSASEAQVSITLDVDVSTLGAASVTVPITVTVASGTATIDKITCGGSPPVSTAPPEIGVTTGLVNVVIPNPPGLSLNVLGGLGGLSPEVVNVSGTLGVGSFGNSQGPTILNGVYPEAIPGEQSLNLSSSNLVVTLLGIPVPIGNLLSPLTSLVNNVLTPIIDPLLDDLGVNVGSATVGNPGPTVCGGSDTGFLF